jgi:predicted  nucleic acid-binding Zn-ribbon protein
MDILSVLKSNVDESGNISASKFDDVAKAINSAVGKEFVEKKRYNDKLTEIDALKAEKNDAEDKVTNAEKWKTKYDALKEEFTSYKNDISAKETKATRSNAYKELLKQAGVSEKRLDSVLKVSDIDSLEMGEDGKFKDADKLIENIKTEWADFITTTETRGAKTSTPPSNNGGGKMTKAEIMKIEDDGERQKAIAENHELFGF